MFQMFLPYRIVVGPSFIKEVPQTGEQSGELLKSKKKGDQNEFPQDTIDLLPRKILTQGSSNKDRVLILTGQFFWSGSQCMKEDIDRMKGQKLEQQVGG
ncbi:hypothetical protein HPP92_006959 [Vanilla planifolia]|uniref:Uncharacterized protein n=1 Tax=Vanilla planifolia TaxID=51239 RepID=A0A835RJH1_VANPL|nr:hypothetical protein HPP92_006959 [Vanilla planifolia]